MKPQGNHPLRFPTIYNIDISKKEMGIITNQGLIKAVDENGFVIFDSDNLSGSHVYWSNLKEIRQSADESSIVLIYKNMSDEILGNHHFGWNELMGNIPDDFGDFSNMMINSETVVEKPSQNLSEQEEEIEAENAEYILSKINEMREDFMNDGEEKLEETVEESVVSDEIEEVEAIDETPEQASPAESKEEEREIETIKQAKTTNNQDLLQKILAESSGSSYDGNLRFQNSDSELDKNLNFGANTKIIHAGSLGFDAESNGEIHKIDFGKFSDAYFDEKSNSLIFEHRFGKTITVSNKVVDFKNLLSKMPFRFRSFDRKLIS